MWHSTFVTWLKLGEFLRRSIGLISASGRETALPFILTGDEPGVDLFILSG
jgi:hypothetical protein